MLKRCLSTLLMLSVLLTSNSQALMAWQSALGGLAGIEAQTHSGDQHALHNVQVLALPLETQPLKTQSSEIQTAENPHCVQMRMAHLQAGDLPDKSIPMLDCQSDCSCCGGTCSTVAITLDLPLAIAQRQHDLFPAALSQHPLQNAEPLRRPPRF